MPTSLRTQCPSVSNASAPTCARGIGHVVIKKRGSPLTPEALIGDLRLSGDDHRILFLTKVAGKHTVLIGQRVETGRTAKTQS